MILCTLCGGTCRLDAHDGPFTYQRCLACGSSQLHPQPDVGELEEFYKRYHLSDGEYAEFDERMQADFPMKARLVRRLFSQQAHTLRLLDVGCGKGFFVREAQAAGFEAEGIDLSPSGIEYAVTQLGMKARVGNLGSDAIPEWSNAFDAATLWATLEHLPRPLESLKAIHACLKPGGILVCDTGLGDSSLERLLPGHSQWYAAPQHLFVFSREGLTSLVRQAGFDPLWIDANFERTWIRRAVKRLRHACICAGAFIGSAPFLGPRGFARAKLDAKWPIGRLLSIAARKRAA
jgi:SAM-dependent methyltransferase